MDVFSKCICIKVQEVYEEVSIFLLSLNIHIKNS